MDGIEDGNEGLVCFCGRLFCFPCDHLVCSFSGRLISSSCDSLVYCPVMISLASHVMASSVFFFRPQGCQQMSIVIQSQIANIITLILSRLIQYRATSSI